MKEVKATTSQGLPLLLQQGRFAEFPESFRHYLMKSWVRAATRFTGKMPERLRGRFSGILQNQNTQVTMALFPDEQAKRGEERIIGWVVSGGSATLHYVYVRNVYRHGGAGRVLVATVDTDTGALDCSHWAKGLPKNGELDMKHRFFRYIGSDIIR